MLNVITLTTLIAESIAFQKEDYFLDFWINDMYGVECLKLKTGVNYPVLNFYRGILLIKDRGYHGRKARP